MKNIEKILGLPEGELIEAAKEYGVNTDGSKEDILKDIINKYGADSNKKVVMGELEILADGYGFLRNSNLGSDTYVSVAQIKRFDLRRGDLVFGEVRRAREGEKNGALSKLLLVNYLVPGEAKKRPKFDDLTPHYPDEQIVLEQNDNSNLSARIIDMFSPLGMGQRSLVVAPPKAGKTILMTEMANNIIKNHKSIKVWILLIDERPEEVTDIRSSVKGAEVFSSTFDEEPQNHIRVAESVLEKAKREVESGNNVVILMDSLTRLARSYNIVMPSSGKLISGGVDPIAIYMPKRFFGAARNIKGGGSLTIVATALVDTGSRMDDVIYEEFKGTGNMELHLDRELSEMRLFPAIDIKKSGTRREELLISKDYLEIIWNLRRSLNDLPKAEALKQLTDLVKKCGSNKELLGRFMKSK